MNVAKKEVTGINSGFNQGFKSAVGLAWTWISFEAFTCGKYRKDLVRDRISYFVSDFGTDYSLDYNSFPDELKRSLIQLKSYSILDMRPSHLLDAPFQISNIKDLDQVLNAVYRVRNNLLHGGKDMKETNDMTLVLCASKVLYYILEKFLSKDGILK